MVQVLGQKILDGTYSVFGQIKLPLKFKLYIYIYIYVTWNNEKPWLKIKLDANVRRRKHSTSAL